MTSVDIERLYTNTKNLFKFIIIILIFLTISAIGLLQVFGPVENVDKQEVFVIPEVKDKFNVTEELFRQKFIKKASIFKYVLNLIGNENKIISGGYRLNKNMNAFQIMQKILGSPDLVWVTVPEGLRKEQIGEIISEKLKWDSLKLSEWNDLNKNENQEYFEGVYFPDTYLIPKDEAVEDVAKRFINKFEENMAGVFEKFTEKDIKWTTGLKIASLIQREAAGIDDMNLISGIIWNRLDQGIKLQIDATMQYTKGKDWDGKWWGNIDLAEKNADSPYNTYLYKGLPPTPICNPGMPAILAALNPETTDCIFYLHDKEKQIHCAKTYASHKANIDKYLKSN